MATTKGKSLDRNPASLDKVIKQMQEARARSSAISKVTPAYFLVYGHENAPATPFLNQILRGLLIDFHMKFMKDASVTQREIGVCISPAVYKALDVMTQSSRPMPELEKHLVVAVRKISQLKESLAFYLEFNEYLTIHLRFGLDEALQDWEARIDFGGKHEVIGTSDDRLYQ